MNKRHWVTILLDGTVEKSKILDFLDMSCVLIEGKEKTAFKETMMIYGIKLEIEKEY